MRTSLSLVVCVCLLASCLPETDAALRQLIEEHGLTGDPAAGVEVPSIDDPVAVLGRKLFFSKNGKPCCSVFDPNSAAAQAKREAKAQASQNAPAPVAESDDLPF